MAIWCFNKTIAYGAIASVALVYYIIVLHNRKEEKKTDTIPDNTTVISKVKQVVSSLPNLNTSNPVKPPRNKRLYRIPSKTVEDCNLIMQNNIRCFTHNESSDTIIINNSPSSFEHGFRNTKDNLNPVVIHINNSINSINNKVQIKVSNSPVKLSTLNTKTVYASDDSSTNCKNRSTSLTKINQKNEPREINIKLPSFNRRRLVEYFMTFRRNRLTNIRDNKCTKEIERNSVTIIINTST